MIIKSKINKVITSFALLVVLAVSVYSPALVNAQSLERQLVPVSISYEPVNGFSAISKVFSLPPYANPADIPIGSFEMFGQYFTFGFMTQDYTMYTSVIEMREAIAIETSTNSLNDILPSIEREIWFDRDGYTGLLTLDMHSIRSESAGTTTRSSTVRRTRTYPHLPSQDSSLIPRTINEGGINLNLYSVSWQASSSSAVVDGLPMGATYTATAVYTGSLSQTSTVGYVTTAEYTGTVSRLAQSQILYTVVFFGTYVEPLYVADEAELQGSSGSVSAEDEEQDANEEELLALPPYGSDSPPPVGDGTYGASTSRLDGLVEGIGGMQLVAAMAIVIIAAFTLIALLKPKKLKTA